MAWIESHQSLRRHPKTRRAAHALGVSIPTLMGHLHCLWHECIDIAEDGDLSSFDPIDIALAAEWQGDPDEFVEALIDCGPGDTPGFLEEGGVVGDPSDGETAELVLHDWWDYAGKLVARRRRDRRRKRRERASDDAPETSEGGPRDVQRTSRGGSHDGRKDVPMSRDSSPTNQPTANQPTTSLGLDPPDDQEAAESFQVSVEAVRLTRHLAEGVAGNDHSLPSRGSSAVGRWYVEADRLLRLGEPGEGGYVPDLEEAMAVADWAVSDHGDGNGWPGWAANIRSMRKFREKFNRLRMQAQSGSGPRDPPSQEVSEFTATGEF